MLCPRCSATLVPAHRHGHTIAVCSRCGGVWLDSGVLEKITGHPHHEAGDVPSAPPPDAPTPGARTSHDDDRWIHHPDHSRE